MDVKDMYSCFSNSDELQPVGDDEGVPSNPATPCTPVTPINPNTPSTPLQPNTPSTPASHSISDDTDKSAFSVSIDSGLGSPDEFCLPQSHGANMRPVRNLVTTNRTIHKLSKAADHTNKEKQRRERIKESCDQLRVLLPYIRGRKTDMASTLEMCVDYLHIVNTFMPQTLQDEIVDMLAKDPNMGQNRDPLSRRQAKDSKASLDISKATATITNGSALPSPALDMMDSQKKASSPPTLMTLTPVDTVTSVCADIRSYMDNKGPKRMRLQADTATEGTSLDGRLDPTVAGHGEVKVANYIYHPPSGTGLHNGSSFQDIEDQNYTRLYSGTTFPDTYNSTQQYFTTFNPTKANSIEPEPLRPMYVDSTLYRYYPSVLPSNPDQNRLYNPVTDYVNPNTVLPGAPYNNLRLKSSADGMKEDSAPRATNA